MDWIAARCGFRGNPARLNLTIICVKNVDGPVHTIMATPIHLAEQLPSDLIALPFVVPLFTPETCRLAVVDAERRGFAIPFVLVDPTAIVARTTAIGPGSFVNSGAVIGAAGQIGRFALINRSGSIGHHVTIGDYASVGPGRCWPRRSAWAAALLSVPAR